MTTISIQEAQAKLTDLIHHLTPGDKVVITENNQPVARLVPTAAAPVRKPRQPGTLRGTVVHMAADFDAPLDDFKDYGERITDTDLGANATDNQTGDSTDAHSDF